MTVCVFGSINMDITAYMDHLPKPGETLHGRDYNFGLGGKGANQAAAVRKLGSDVRFICRVGPDDFAVSARRELESYGIDTALVGDDPAGATGLALINVGENAENSISLIAGSNMRLDASDVERGRAALETAAVLLLQIEVPLAASLKAAAVARAGGATVIFDPAPVPPGGLPLEVLKQVDIVTPNETETGQILGWVPSGLEEGLKAARELRGHGVPTAIVKLGARGLAVASEGVELIVPAFKVMPIDTVAAGDSFNGGLAHALEQGKPLAEAVRYAAACGALSTTKKGSAAAAPTKAEVEAFLAKA